MQAVFGRIADRRAERDYALAGIIVPAGEKVTVLAREQRVVLGFQS